MAVRVGRLRGAVKAAADAMRIAAGLSILKRMSRARTLSQLHDSYSKLSLRLKSVLQTHGAR